MAGLGTSKINEEDMAQMSTKLLFKPLHIYAKLTFLVCQILLSGGGLRSSDGHIGYGKGERKWAKKNAFHQPRSSSRKNGVQKTDL